MACTASLSAVGETSAARRPDNCFAMQSLVKEFWNHASHTLQAVCGATSCPPWLMAPFLLPDPFFIARPRSGETTAMVTNDSQALIVLSEMRKALARADTLEELTKLRDGAEALRCLVVKAKLGLQMHNEAAEFKLRAERKAGEMLASMQLNGGDRKSVCHDVKLKLEHLGISYHQSSRWQREAAVSEAQFDEFIRQANEAEKEITAAELLRRAVGGRSRRPSRPRTVHAPRKTNGFAVPAPRAEKSSAAPADDATLEATPLKELLADAEEHRALLTSILLPYCEHGKPIEAAARRHAAHLLRELESLLKRVRRLAR